MRGRILLISWLFVCYAASAMAGSRHSAKEANELIKQLKKLQSQGHYAEMVDPSKQLVEIVCQTKSSSSPDCGQWLTIQGVIYFAVGEYDNAERSSRAAIDVFQKVRRPLTKEMRDLASTARVQLASVLQASGRLGEARET